MATLEERVSYLEGKVEDQSRTTGDLRDLVAALDQKVDRRFEALDRRFEAFERRFEAFDRRFEAFEQKVDRRFEAVEQKFEHRFDLLERRFTWVIGIQLSTLLTIVVGLLGIIGALVRQ